jgi:signal recognition particle subunit SRP54
MDELGRIKAAVNPTEIMLVVDAMIGQDAVTAAKAFDDALDITGVFLTKLDGDARGGAAPSIRAVTGKPIKFAGIGEKLDGIEAFHPDRMASRILGMGDVLSLIEKAQQNVDEKKAAEQLERLRKNKFTLADFYDQLVQFKSMGSMQDIMSMVPGMSGKNFTVDEKGLAKTEAIILSMTPAERENPSILGSSRKKRIAAGSGTQVSDVNRLLKQFDLMQNMVKQMTSGKGMFGQMRRGGFPGMPGMGGMGRMGRKGIFPF